MSALKKIVVDFSVIGSTAMSVRDWLIENVKPKDEERCVIVLKNIEAVSDKYVIALLDRWSSRFPGRIFLQAPDAPRTPRSSALALLIKARFPVLDEEVIFSGKIILSSSDDSIPLRILKGGRPERLPVSENLFLVCRLEEADILAASIPIQGSALKCTIEEDLISLNNCVLVSSEGSDNRIFFVRELDDGLAELLSIQNEHVFARMYQDAVRTANKNFPKASYIRGLSVGWHRTKAALGPALFDALVTKKQLNVLRTVELMDSRFEKFFQNYDPRQRHDPVESNFEHKILMKRIRSQPVDQPTIDAMIAQSIAESNSITDMVLEGKRARRTIGTSYNSHRWPNGLVPLALFDGALLSEVIGSQVIN